MEKASVDQNINENIFEGYVLQNVKCFESTIKSLILLKHKEGITQLNLIEIFI